MVSRPRAAGRHAYRTGSYAIGLLGKVAVRDGVISGTRAVAVGGSRDGDCGSVGDGHVPVH